VVVTVVAVKQTVVTARQALNKLGNLQSHNENEILLQEEEKSK